MERSPRPTLHESSKTFVLRSTIVLMPTNPSFAFRTSSQDLSLMKTLPGHLLFEDRMFPEGTVVRQGFKGPIMQNGKRAWHGYRYLEGKVFSVRTEKGNPVVSGVQLAVGGRCIYDCLGGGGKQSKRRVRRTVS